MREKELRIALVCYGGVSLAIYMHGVTKEIWRLARASRSFHDGLAPSSGSQGVYHRLLRDVADRQGLQLRVLCDIVAGSSAGGINGIFLSHAIVTGQSLDPLTDLWLDCADVDKLLAADARPLSRMSKLWATPIAWAALNRKGGTIDQTVAPEARSEIAEKMSRFVRARWFEPPFGGREFSAMLLDAMDAMQASEARFPLLPKGQPLDLFVTVTDYHGHRVRLPINSPPMVEESEHRLNFSFSSGSRSAPESWPDPVELVFAARATASFPGAFPPFSIAEMDGLLQARNRNWPTRHDFLKRSFPGHFSATGAVMARHFEDIAQDIVLIDGSVLNNAPFRPAIEALTARPARRQVDRRFVYIDPHPGKRDRGRYIAPIDDDGSVGAPPVPGFFSTIMAALSSIPREQPIRDNLVAIDGRSDRIERMRQITDSLQGDVEQAIESMLGRTLLLSRPSDRRLGIWRANADEKASKGAGFSYASYAMLRLDGVIDDLVRLAQRLGHDQHHRRHQLRNALRDALSRRGLFRATAGAGRGASGAILSFFTAHDLRFRIRRLRHLARRLAVDVEDQGLCRPDAANAMHDAIYSALALYLEHESGTAYGPALDALAEDAVEAPDAYLDGLAAIRALPELDARCDAMLATALNGLDSHPRRILLLAYLGFAMTDIATLPLLQGEGLGEFDAVKVDRISPLDAQSLRKGDAEATLKGVQFNNFGAFFSRSYRENDYLWGRLHGAERMIDLIFSTLPNAADDTQRLDWKMQLFAAVLDEERPRLSRIAPLFAELDAAIQAHRAAARR